MNRGTHFSLEILLSKEFREFSYKFAEVFHKNLFREMIFRGKKCGANGQNYLLISN